jgi:hypothetical protein
MSDPARLTLLTALALAADSVGPGVDGVPAADDPLKLDLPNFAPGQGEAPKPATVRVFGSLYLAAELEQAGVVPIAELLASEKDSLDITSFDTAAKLDDFAGRAHQWYDRAGRVQIYSRLFGIGPGATNNAGTLVNREFMSLLAGLCRAIARSADASVGAQGLEAGIQITASMLLANLAPRGLANTLLAARRLEDQVRRAVDLLRDPAICALVGARTLQETILNILGKDAPDVQRLIDSGVAGQKVLEWLAAAAPRLGSGAGPLLAPGDPVGISALLWLQAVGLAGDTQQQQVAA